MKVEISEKTVILPLKRRYYFRAEIPHEKNLGKELKIAVDKAYKKGFSLAEPILYRKILKRDELKNSKFINYSEIPKEIQKSEYILLFVSSLGKKIDSEISFLLKEKKILFATLLDAWASESIEALNDWFTEENIFEKKTMRYSPGYGKFNILNNFKFINEFLPQKEIKANEKTGILLPRKSTVCLVGLKNRGRNE